MKEIETVKNTNTAYDWIRISEAKPKENVVVQAYSPTSNRQFIGYRCVQYKGTVWEREQWYLEGARGASYAFPCKVTHWKPLSEPPII